MNTEALLYYMFNLSFVIIFTVLCVLTLFMHMPKDDSFRSYRKSRYILGAAFALMAVYCIFRLCIIQHQNDYLHFWILIFISLIFSWMNYTSFLFLINSDHKIRRHFFIDGIMPSLLIILLGVLGDIIPALQEEMSSLLGLIFLFKCIWMFYIAEREWRKVNTNLMEVYDENPDISWIRQLVWLTMFLSIGTLFSWYLPWSLVLFDISAPLIYFYMVIKLVNYYPRKIEEMRNENLLGTNDLEPFAKATPISKNILMLEPKIQSWIDDKKFCRANLSIKDVALEMGTNHNYLSKYLNSCLNVSFQVWLNTLRIEESKNILAAENVSIEEVGAKVGIPLSYNFSRWFKIVTGETPFRYRQHTAKAAHL